MGYYTKSVTQDKFGSGSVSFNIAANTGDVAISAGWDIGDASTGKIRKLRPNGIDTWNVEFVYDSDNSVTIWLLCYEA